MKSLFLLAILALFPLVSQATNAYQNEQAEIASKVSLFQKSVDNQTILPTLGQFISPTVKIYMNNHLVKAPYSNNWFYSLEKVVNNLSGEHQNWTLTFSAGKDKPETFQYVPVASLNKVAIETWSDIKDIDESYAKTHTAPSKPPQLLNTMLHFCVSSSANGNCDILKVNEEVSALFEFKGHQWMVTHITASPNADIRSNFATKWKLSSLFF